MIAVTSSTVVFERLNTQRRLKTSHETVPNVRRYFYMKADCYALPVFHSETSVVSTVMMVIALFADCHLVAAFPTLACAPCSQFGSQARPRLSKSQIKMAVPGRVRPQSFLQLPRGKTSALSCFMHGNAGICETRLAFAPFAESPGTSKTRLASAPSLRQNSRFRSSSSTEETRSKPFLFLSLHKNEFYLSLRTTASMHYVMKRNT